MFSIAADTAASAPDVAKSWSQPDTESYQVYLAACISSTLTLLTIDEWNFATYGFPLYIFAICFVLVLLIRFEFGVRIKSVLRPAAP